MNICQIGSSEYFYYTLWWLNTAIIWSHKNLLYAFHCIHFVESATWISFSLPMRFSVKSNWTVILCLFGRMLRLSTSYMLQEAAVSPLWHALLSFVFILLTLFGLENAETSLLWLLHGNHLTKQEFGIFYCTGLYFVIVCLSWFEDPKAAWQVSCCSDEPFYLFGEQRLAVYLGGFSAFTSKK